ncbi:hypothetical protein P3S68_005575 [Capsicum galapagoense]
MATKLTQRELINQNQKMANLDSVDEFYFSVLFDHEESLFPISDEMYAEEFQLQEALMSAATISVFNKCCIAKYVTKRTVLENVTVIKCPDTACNAVINPKLWRELVPKEVLDKWENAMSESLVLGSRKLYCPYKDCSAMLVVDGSDTVIDTECPDCRRLFCARCNVPWHVGLECKEFQHSGGSNERGKGGVMMTGTAKNKKWRRCSKCKCYVEKVDDCLHLTCRCGYEFCY